MMRSTASRGQRRTRARLDASVVTDVVRHLGAGAAHAVESMARMSPAERKEARGRLTQIDGNALKSMSLRNRIEAEASASAGMSVTEYRRATRKAGGAR